MKSITSIFLGAALLALAGCKSDDSNIKSAEMADIPCTCGSPEASLHGCACPMCMSGDGNSENPDCVCAPFDYAKE